MIKKVGRKYQVRSEDGKRLLGTHNTKREAEAQLRAIHASQRRRGKKR